MNKPENTIDSDIAGPQPRHHTTQVKVGNVAVGGGAPIVVQSMTNTDTADVDGTIAQVAALSRAGSEMVRITVDREEAAAAVLPSPSAWAVLSSAARRRSSCSR